jgi:hypothetical protein
VVGARQAKSVRGLSPWQAAKWIEILQYLSLENAWSSQDFVETSWLVLEASGSEGAVLIPTLSR